MLSTIFRTGKNMMIFGAICMLAATFVFFGYDTIYHSDLLVLYWATRYLGHYGFTAFFGVAGLIFILLGWMMKRSDKSKAENNQ